MCWGKIKGHVPTLPAIVSNFLCLGKAAWYNLLQILLTVKITQMFPLQAAKYDR